MPAKVIITTDFPTPEEVAAHLRIPATRVKELRRQIEQMVGSGAAAKRSPAPPRKQSAKKK